MKLNKFAYLYSKPLGNHTLKINKKIPGNLLKNLEKSWKYHGILLVRKSGNPGVGLDLIPWRRLLLRPGHLKCAYGRSGEVPSGGDQQFSDSY